MSIQSTEEWEGMKRASEIVGKTLREMQAYAAPGMSTWELDQYGRELLAAADAVAAPKKLYDFPGWTCISVNRVAAHGIPSKRVILREGDLVNIDVSAAWNGFYGDNGGSFVLGTDTRNLEPLVEASRTILRNAIAQIRGGVRISALGGYIENEARKRRFTTVKNLVGHGIGRQLHEAPQELPCFRDRSNRERFRTNTVVALETFISTGARYVSDLGDGWSLGAADGSFVAQHEHTILVTQGEPVILTYTNGI